MKTPQILKVKKKAIGLEAIYFEKGKETNALYFLIKNLMPVILKEEGISIEISITLDREGMRVKTLEGEFYAQYDNYIIKDEKGEFYSCKPNVFYRDYIIIV